MQRKRIRQRTIGMLGLNFGYSVIFSKHCSSTYDTTPSMIRCDVILYSLVLLEHDVDTSMKADSHV